MIAKNDNDQLTRLIRRKSREQCLAFFAGISPAERRKFAKQAFGTLKRLDKEWMTYAPRERKPLFKKPLDEQMDNARVCVLATATPGELKKLGWRAIPKDGFIVNVVRDLKLDWVNQWVQDLSEAEPRTYSTIRLLYQAGLCDKPSGDGYVLGMIEGLPGWRIAPSALWEKDTPLAERIRKTPDIRDEDVWRLFEVEGGGDLSLSSFDKYIAKKIGGWTEALIELSNEGTLDRDRLLDESLNTLGKDFAQFRANWFSTFHEAMQPTLRERIARRDQYLRLLGSSIPPTVSFALKTALKLDKAGELPPADVMACIQPVLQARAKGTVISGLKLIAKAAKCSPELSEAACELASTALIHEAADVQKKALDLIDSLDGPTNQRVVAALSDYRSSVAPSLRSRLTAMTGTDESAQDLNLSDSHSAEEPVSAIKPILTFDELIQEFSRILEDPSQPLQIERVLDGLARLGASEHNDFDKLTGPLRKRSTAIIKQQPFDQLQFQLAHLAQSFAATNPLTDNTEFRFPDVDIAPYSKDKKRVHRSFEEVFVKRYADLLTQVQAKQHLPLLSAPSDSRGFVGAKALLSRYAEYSKTTTAPGPTDTALALMRLSPDERGSALTDFNPVDEYERAFAFALGADIASGETHWLWVAAAAARLPYANEPEISDRHGSGYPDAGTRARYSIEYRKTDYFTWLMLRVKPRIKSTVPSTFLAPMFHLTSAGDNSYGAVCGYHVNMIRWCSTIWPLNLEPFFSQGVSVFDHSQKLSNTPYAGFLEPMLQSHVKIEDMGCVLLALGLASSDPAVRSIALEAAITSIDENRLNNHSLHQAFILLLPSGHAPLGRWTKSLTELSGISTKHEMAVRDLIDNALRHDPTNPPRDIGGLVELFYELSIALDKPVTDSKTLGYLSGVTGGGKLKRFAKKLLTLS